MHLLTLIYISTTGNNIIINTGKEMTIGSLLTAIEHQRVQILCIVLSRKSQGKNHIFFLRWCLSDKYLSISLMTVMKWSSSKTCNNTPWQLSRLNRVISNVTASQTKALLYKYRMKGYTTAIAHRMNWQNDQTWIWGVVHLQKNLINPYRSSQQGALQN